MASFLTSWGHFKSNTPLFTRFIRCSSVISRSTTTIEDYGNFEYLSSKTLKHHRPVQVAGRTYLPGANSKHLPKYLSTPRDKFPVVVKVIDQVDGGGLINQLRKLIDSKLPTFPAILFKNVPFTDITELSKLILDLKYDYVEYIGGAVDRNNVVDYLNTASNDPPDFTVEPHNEMAYSSFIPHKILFACLKSPPNGGGEAVIADNKLIMKNLDSDVLKKFKEKGLKYISYLPNHATSKSENTYMPWQQRLLTECKKEAETRIKSLGYDFVWHDDGSLTYWLNLPALRPHPVTGESIWCNQAIPHHKSYFQYSPMNDELKLPEEKLPYNTQYGDGTEIEPDVVEHVRKVTWECSIGFPWEPRDLLVLDNYFVQHGRMSFSGARQLLVTLTRN